MKAGKVAMGVGENEFRQWVYDKKLLWRANLYIDETRSEDGSTTGNTNENLKKDWNNANKWNAPANQNAESIMRANGTLPKWWRTAWGYNEWNVKADGTPGDGGQVVRIASWTHFNSDQVSRGNGPLTVGNAVAYNYAGLDSPFIFNQKMNCQALALDKKNNTSNVSTLAPPAYPGATARDWNNYVGVAEVKEIALKKKKNELGQTPYYTAIQDQMTSVFSAYTSTQKPYIPSLAIFFFAYYSPPVNYSDSMTMTVYGAGVQCSGIVQRAMGYSGNTFPIIGSNIRPYTDDIKNNDWSKFAQAFTSVKYFESDLAYEMLSDQGQTLDHTNKHIIPGDILRYDWGADGNHIAIVQSVEYEADGTIKPDNVVLIEAAGGVDFPKKPKHVVMSRETWNDYQDFRDTRCPGGELHVGRLRYQ